MPAYTLDAAYASFEEKLKGSIKKDKLADFVIMYTELTTIQPSTIWDAKVMLTMVGGKVVYERK